MEEAEEGSSLGNRNLRCGPCVLRHVRQNPGHIGLAVLDKSWRMN